MIETTWEHQNRIIDEAIAECIKKQKDREAKVKRPGVMTLEKIQQAQQIMNDAEIPTAGRYYWDGKEIKRLDVKP